MASDIVQPYIGTTVVDLTPLGSILVDIIPGGMRYLRREQEGIDGVIGELSTSAPLLVGPVQLSPEVYTQFQTLNTNLGHIRAARVLIDKLAEVLVESEAKYEHDREAVIGKIADAVKSAARRTDRSLLGPFEKTLAYNNQVAMRAVKTRRKNAELAQAEADADDEAQTEPTPAPQAP